MSLLKKSYQLRRFHLGLVLIILSILVSTMLRYAAILEASLEQTTLATSMLNITQRIQLHNLMHPGTEACQALDNPDFFAGIASSSSSEHKGQWYYDAAKHTLYYFVRAQAYFWSSFAQKVKIGLYCKQGLISYEISPFKWCAKKNLFGCEQDGFE